jgi:ketosteroid isomerase-like protein
MNTMIIRLILKSSLALLSCAFIGVAQAAPEAEKALRDADTQWSAAAETRNLDKTLSYYTADAIVMPPNVASATTREAVRSAWKELLGDSNLIVSWKATKVEVAHSSEIGYVAGTYEVKDSSSKSANDRGKYVEVFKKQADGTWKCVADIWNSDLPLPAPNNKQ